MNPELIVVIAGGVLTALCLIFRTNSAVVFASLCAGAVLSKLVASDTTQVVNSIIALNVPMSSIVQIFLLIIAPLVLLIGLRKSVKVPGVIWQIVPAAAAGILLIYFLPQMLPYDVQKTVIDSNLYKTINPYFGLAAAAGLLASVIYFWALKPKHHDKHGKKHKK